MVRGRMGEAVAGAQEVMGGWGGEEDLLLWLAAWALASSRLFSSSAILLSASCS